MIFIRNVIYLYIADKLWGSKAEVAVYIVVAIRPGVGCHIRRTHVLKVVVNLLQSGYGGVM